MQLQTPEQVNPTQADFTEAQETAMHVDRDQLEALMSGRLINPFNLLGPHTVEGHTIVRTYQPGASAVHVVHEDGLISLEQIGDSGLYAGALPAGTALPAHYRLSVEWPGEWDNESVVQEVEDPYSFGLLLGDMDLYLIGEGRHYELGRCLGAQPQQLDGIDGTRFAVWAPNAQRVSVVGDFNSWDGRRHPMRLRYPSGVWEIFLPRVTAGAVYKYEIVSADGHVMPLKADPIARATQLPPLTASVVASNQPFTWTDEQWLAQRGARQQVSSPLSIYEVHAGSWARLLEEGARSFNWNELGDRLIPYVLDMGFTHVQFMPIMEHPFGGSWGYQPLAQFAPSARFGSPEEFARFVDRCHQHNLGVLLDWVPAHFPTDAHGLAHFDGSALYEHQNPQEGFHPDWNTNIYNLGRNEVCGFLIASALEWLERYHVDGLRIDAVASMLYRDYSRKQGEWVPNIYGGRENLESVAFLRALNQAIHERCPDALMIAEDSTAWPGVTKPVNEGGLGFNYKWNMGWMNDTLRYMETDPIYRRYHHNEMTFGLVYAFNENFVLPISHDEVVHGKGSLLNKMPGDDWQKRANLRAYLSFMWTHPGKKLLFMSCELGQYTEWNHDTSPEWHLLDNPHHKGIQLLLKDLNRLYGSHPALHALDNSGAGFEWLISDDGDNSVFAFMRKGGNAAPLVIVCNMTPVPRDNYVVPLGWSQDFTHTRWRELLNSDAGVYGGSDFGNLSVAASRQEQHTPSTLALRLPPLGTIVLSMEH